VYCNFDVVFIEICTPCSPISASWSTYKAHTRSIPMEPLARDLWHNRDATWKNFLQQLMGKLRELEGTITWLSNQIEECFNYFEANLSSLARRLDDMEVTVQTLRDPGPIQHSTSDSVNLGRPGPNDGVVENKQGSFDRGTTPMDTGEDPSIPQQNPEAHIIKICVLGNNMSKFISKDLKSSRGNLKKDMMLFKF